MNNTLDKKIIFNKTLPFLAIFVLSLSLALFNFTQRYTKRAKAQAEGVVLNLTNILSPITDNNTWEWRVDVGAQNHIGEPADIAYTVSWCRETFGKAGEGEGRICNSELTPLDFIRNLAEETRQLTIIDQQFFNITHTSVSCGRVYIEFTGFEVSLGNEVYDTGIECEASMISTPTPIPETKYGVYGYQCSEISLS